MSQQSVMEEIREKLADLNATVEEHLGEPYVSIPVGYHLAVEITFEEPTFYVHVIGWDVTGGINHEQWYASSERASNAAQFARKRAEDILAEQKRLSKEEDAHFAEKAE